MTGTDKPIACGSGGRIEHIGEVVSITDKHINVMLRVRSACAHCSVRGGCGMADEKPRIVPVVRQTGQPAFEHGETVTVVMTRTHGTRAVLLGYLAPFVVLVAVLFGTSAAGLGENAAALAGLAGVGVYYALLWRLRDRIVKQFAFEIEKRSLR